MTHRILRSLAIALALSGVLAASLATPASGETLNGTFGFGKFKLNKKTKRASGSYFRMVYPNGNPKKGPFFANSNSTSRNKSYTALKAGIDGGLQTGAFQEQPNPPFAPNGFALANRIMQPTLFAGIKFSLSTAATDAQSNTKVGVPIVNASGSKLSGDLRSFTASWNSIYFNQGSPKPAGNLPGSTRRVSGTYNAKTKRYTLTWVSQIVGGPFNDFAGYWHLQGTFKPRTAG